MSDGAGASGDASGFTCPDCGGALWEHRAGDSLAFECRIGDRFEAAELWIDHCAARNRALKTAERALAENGALARRLAAWAAARGESETAALLAREAAEEERLRDQVRAMLDGLPESASESRGHQGGEGRTP
jgi:two-component system, chemotaxis family, protein-glutamate methylesterase/glutaminase